MARSENKVPAGVIATFCLLALVGGVALRLRSSGTRATSAPTQLESESGPAVTPARQETNKPDQPELVTHSPSATNTLEPAQQSTVSPSEAQQNAIRDFLAKMTQHSKILHEEFDLREQLRALHPAEGENTNHLVFAAMREAFQELGRQAGTNDTALQVLLAAARDPYLEGVAVHGLGVAAETGNARAVELLIEPDKNGWPLSSSAGALVKVAQAGNPQAIDFMYQLTTDPKNKALWWFASDALARPAAEGDERAVAGLINLAPSENASVHRQVMRSLSAAASAGSETAAAALKALQ